ncbi:MAG: hypothetical protein GY778_21665, partial [bacterium]|nr:hypothetical protein [bacterium]
MTEDLDHPASAKPPGFLTVYRLPVSVTAHAAIFAISLLAAFALAYNFANVKAWFVPIFLPILAFVAPIKLVVFWLSRQYQGSWRYVGLRDVFGVIRAAFISGFFFILVFFTIVQIWGL